jgi:hypothetical protein
LGREEKRAVGEVCEGGGEVWEVPFVRPLGCAGCSKGGICSQRACVGCMILGMNIVLVWVS